LDRYHWGKEKDDASFLCNLGREMVGEESNVLLPVEINVPQGRQCSLGNITWHLPIRKCWGVIIVLIRERDVPWDRINVPPTQHCTPFMWEVVPFSFSFFVYLSCGFSSSEIFMGQTALDFFQLLSLSLSSLPKVARFPSATLPPCPAKLVVVMFLLCATCPHFPQNWVHLSLGLYVHSLG